MGLRIQAGSVFTDEAQTLELPSDWSLSAVGGHVIAVPTGLASAATTPTNSELFASTYWPTAMTVTTSLGLLTLPFAADIKAASVVMMNAGIVADDTNYWTVEVMSWRNTDGVAAVLATKNSKLTGGQAFTQRADWNFDAVTFANNIAVAKGYTIGMRFTPTGAPASFNGALMTVRYEPS